MSQPEQPLVIKPKKLVPLSFMAIFFACSLLITWPVSLFALFILGVISLLLVGYFVDTYSGYLKLDDGELYRKSLLTMKSIKVSDIREVTMSGSGVFATSSLSAGTLELGNAKDGHVSIKASAYKKAELTSLIEQLYSELKSANPKRAEELKQFTSRQN